MRAKREGINIEAEKKSPLKEKRKSEQKVKAYLPGF